MPRDRHRSADPKVVEAHRAAEREDSRFTPEERPVFQIRRALLDLYTRSSGIAVEHLEPIEHERASGLEVRTGERQRAPAVPPELLDLDHGCGEPRAGAELDRLLVASGERRV